MNDRLRRERVKRAPFHMTKNKYKYVLIGCVAAAAAAGIIALSVYLVHAVPSSQSNPPTGLGVCYDSGILNGTPSAAEIRECILDDFMRIKKSGYSYLRTYFPLYGYSGCSPAATMGMYTELGKLAGLKVLIGVQASQYSTYKDCIVESISKFPEAVMGVSIGNEDVQDNNWSVAQTILDCVTDLKGALTSRISKMVKFGTCQQSGFWLCIGTTTGQCICDPNACGAECVRVYKRLLTELDFCGANLYPGSGGPSLGTEDADRNKKSLDLQFECLLNAVGSSKLWITETGLPYAGSCPDGQGATVNFSPYIQDRYIADVREVARLHAGIPIFLFCAFDVPSKKPIPGCDISNNTENRMGVIKSQKCSRADK